MKKCAALLLVGLIHALLSQVALAQQEKTALVPLPSLEDFSNWTRHLGDGNTQWLAMKGVHPDDELQALPADFRLTATHVLKVPGCQGQRHLLILRRSV